MTARRIDRGRIGMVVFSTILGALSLQRAVSLVHEASIGTTITTGLVAVFYILLVWAYLRRGPARATTMSRSAMIAAPVATFLPFLLPFAGIGGADHTIIAVGTGLMVVGLLWSVWSLFTLGRNVSIVPQARTLVTSGPYAWIRHPLYLGEIITVLGLSLTLGGVLPVVGWGLLVVLQGYRALHEEALLVSTIPEYRAYQTTTARIVPSIF